MGAYKEHSHEEISQEIIKFASLVGNTSEVGLRQIGAMSLQDWELERPEAGKALGGAQWTSPSGGFRDASQCRTL